MTNPMQGFSESQKIKALSGLGRREPQAPHVQSQLLGTTTGVSSTPGSSSTLINRLGDIVEPRPGVHPLDSVPVVQRETVELPSGRQSAAIPGVPQYPMPTIPGKYEPPRDGNGRYLIANPITGTVTGHTRVTTMSGSLKSSWALDQWKDAQLIKGLIKFPELVEGLEADVIGTNKEYVLKNTLSTIAENARVAMGAADKREFGSAVHAWTEAIDTGVYNFSMVPEIFREHVAAYLVSIKDANITVLPQFCERIIYNEETNTIGTVDRIYQLADGSLVIGDLKTSSNIDYAWAEISAQLSQYATGLCILSSDGTQWESLPDGLRTDIGVVASIPGLPGDRDVHSDLYIVDLSVGLEMMKAAVSVKKATSGAARRVPLQHQPFTHTAAEALNLCSTFDYSQQPVQAIQPVQAVQDVQVIQPVQTGDVWEQSKEHTPTEWPTLEAADVLAPYVSVMARIDVSKSPTAIAELWREEWPQELIDYALARIIMLAG